MLCGFQSGPGNALPLQLRQDRAAAGAMAILATTIAAKHQFVLVPNQKDAGEVGIPGKSVETGIGRHVYIEIREFREPLIRQSSGLHWTGRIRDIRRYVLANVGLHKVGVANEDRLWVVLKNLVELAITNIKIAFALKMLNFLEMHQHRHIHFAS